MDKKALLEFVRDEQLLTKTFEYGGRGPDKFDCYGLIRYVYEGVKGLMLPDYTTPTTQAEIGAVSASVVASRWSNSTPMCGSMHFFRMPRKGSHVGLSTGDGKFIHIWERSNGVVIEHLSNWENRLIGTYKFNG